MRKKISEKGMYCIESRGEGVRGKLLWRITNCWLLRWLWLCVCVGVRGLLSPPLTHDIWLPGCLSHSAQANFHADSGLGSGHQKEVFFKSCTCKCSDSDPGTRIIEDLQDPDPGGQKIADKVPKKCRKLAFKFRIYFIKLNTVKIIKQALHLQVNFLWH